MLTLNLLLMQALSFVNANSFFFPVGIFHLLFFILSVLFLLLFALNFERTILFYEMFSRLTITFADAIEQKTTSSTSFPRFHIFF